MIDNYHFNEQKKRFEPKETKCSFCNKESTKNDNYYTSVFKEQDRTNLVVYRNVKYQELKIGIPRCQSCSQIHDSSNTTAWTVCVIIGIGIGVSSFLIWGIFGFFGLFPALLTAIAGPQYLRDFFTENKGTTSVTQGKKNDPLIQEMVINGWTLHPPSA